MLPFDLLADAIVDNSWPSLYTVIGLFAGVIGVLVVLTIRDARRQPDRGEAQVDAGAPADGDADPFADQR